MIALLAAFSLLATACGDDGDGGSDTSGEDEGDGNGAAGETITLGVAYADVSAFAEQNPAFAIGDPEEQAQALVNAWRQDGRLPVNGTQVELSLRSFDAIDDNDKRAVCQAFAEEDEAFAVLAGRIFGAGAECLAERFDVPVIGYDPSPNSVYERAPRLFTVRAKTETTARNFVAWADQEGLLEDQQIGLYKDARAEAATEAFKSELSDRGYDLASEVEVSGQGVGEEQDRVAVQRFQADDVDLAILMVGGVNVTNFMTFAEEQGYAPKYLDFDYSEHMSSVATLGRPEAQMDGVQGVTTNRVGDLVDGELVPPAEECVTMYEEFSGKELPRTAPPPNGEFTNLLQTCDLGEIFIRGLENATESGELTAESFLEGVEQISELELARYDLVSFGPDDHAGAETQRPVVFDFECGCWTPDGEFEPFPIG